VGFKSSVRERVCAGLLTCQCHFDARLNPAFDWSIRGLQRYHHRRPEACSDFGTSLYDFIDDATDLPIAVGGISPGTTSFNYDSSLFDFYGQIDLIVRALRHQRPSFFAEITITLILDAPIAVVPLLPLTQIGSQTILPTSSDNWITLLCRPANPCYTSSLTFATLILKTSLLQVSSAPETSIPEFVYINPAFTYMTINPPLDA